MAFRLIMLIQAPNLFEPLTAIIKKKEPEQPKEIYYKIKDMDTLTSIADATGSSVARLWSKNPSLTNPDVINPGDSLTIPKQDEALADRAMPVKVVVQPVSTQKSPVTGASSSSGSVPVPKGSTAGNLYTPGYCTYYVKNMRPDLPNDLGNASGWIRIANSKTPAIGAVAVNTRGLGHVAIVIAIDGNRTLVRHMNWVGWNIVSENWVDKSFWSGYIL